MAKTRKEIFTVLGKVRFIDEDGKSTKRFIPNSPGHMKALISRLPIGKELACTFFQNVSTRSRAQLAYHWVLMGYLASHTGHTEQEMHEAIMISMYGTKPVRIANKTFQVRASVSDIAKFPKHKMIDVITEDLRLCDEMEIKVPTAEELGYISNNNTYKR